MRQTTTAEVRLDPGKAARFSASARSTDLCDFCCARGTRFTVAHDGRRGKPWPTTARRPGNVGLSPLDEFDQIALWGQQENDAASVECGRGDGPADRHASLLPATREFSIQIFDLVTQVIHPAPAAADDGVDRA